MFGYRVEARLRRDRQDKEETAPPYVLTHDDVKDLATHIALTAVAAYTVISIVGGARDIAVNVANPANYHS